MTDCYVSPRVLLDGGPNRFTRQVERLLWQVGFTDVVNIDGANDKGGDLLAQRHGQVWVLQCRWQARGALPRAGVDEVAEAVDHYRADRAAVVTNVRPGPDALRRARDLGRIGRDIRFWTGPDLVQLWETTDSSTSLRLRDYQKDAVAAAVAALDSAARALLVVATGLGKTVIGGEVIARHLAERPDSPILVAAHTKDLVNQLERALWQHLPKTVRTQVLTQCHLA